VEVGVVDHSLRGMHDFTLSSGWDAVYEARAVEESRAENRVRRGPYKANRYTAANCVLLGQGWVVRGDVEGGTQAGSTTRLGSTERVQGGRKRE